MAPGLLSLPPETLNNIGLQLRSRKTWAALSLTCRQLEAGTRKAWASRSFSEFELELTCKDLGRLVQLGKVDEIASAIKSITVSCEDDDDDPCAELIPIASQQPDTEDHDNLTNERISALVKAFDPLRNLQKVAFMPICESSEREDSAGREIFHVSESFGLVMWTLDVLKIQPRTVTLGQFSNPDKLVGMLSWYILPHLRRSLSAVTAFHLDLLLDESKS